MVTITKYECPTVSETIQTSAVSETATYMPFTGTTILPTKTTTSFVDTISKEASSTAISQSSTSSPVTETTILETGVLLNVSSTSLTLSSETTSSSSFSVIFTPSPTICDCNSNGTVEASSCDPITNACLCKAYVTGQYCDNCISGYFGLTSFGSCQPCECCVSGTTSDICHKVMINILYNFELKLCVRKLVNVCVRKDILVLNAVKVIFMISNNFICKCYFIVLEQRGTKFNGSSHLQYSTQFRRVIREMTFDVTFKPANDTGLILFASKYEDGSGPYFSVQLNRSVEFLMNTGHFKIILRYY